MYNLTKEQNAALCKAMKRKRLARGPQRLVSRRPVPPTPVSCVEAAKKQRGKPFPPKPK